MVGAGAMRQVAEDVLQVAEVALAHSALKEEPWLKVLRRDVETVARGFPKEEREHLTEAVVNMFKNGELPKSFEEKSLNQRRRFLRTTMQDLRSLRSAVEEVAKENFTEKEGQDLTEAVMKGFEKGELDKGLKMSQEEKQRYLLTIVQQMQQDLRSLRSAVKEVAKYNFPEKELYRLTETVMEAFRRRELDKDWNEIARMDQRTQEYYLHTVMNKLRELPVAASAVKFCSELFREANSNAAKYMREVHTKLEVELRVEKELRDRRSRRFREAEAIAQKEVMAHRAKEAAEQESKKAENICHKVLTGELGADDGPEWAEKAANSSQPEGQHYQLGRLQKVNATEKAWKVSLKNVCKDECHELVKEMREETQKIFKDVGSRKIIGPSREDFRLQSYEEVCAKRVVQKVEAEILGCCAESCGWNGRACMYWPFLSSIEKGQWEAECCTEFNILKNSSRATMCDATLTGNENKEVIRDEQPNTEEEREMIGQDPVGKGTSFLQGDDTNGPSPPPENTPIPRHEGTCPDPLNLGKEHSKLKGEWKTTNFPLAQENFKYPGCGGTRPRNSIGNCKAFLPQGVDGKYVCYVRCLGSVDGLVFTNLTDTVPPSDSQLLYVHKSISGE